VPYSLFAFHISVLLTCRRTSACLLEFPATGVPACLQISGSACPPAAACYTPPGMHLGLPPNSLPASHCTLPGLGGTAPACLTAPYRLGCMGVGSPAALPATTCMPVTCLDYIYLVPWTVPLLAATCILLGAHTWFCWILLCCLNILPVPLLLLRVHGFTAIFALGFCHATSPPAPCHGCSACLLAIYQVQCHWVAVLQHRRRCTS